ncbi:VOC family protein [Micromonospora sagamiensis]
MVSCPVPGRGSFGHQPRLSALSRARRSSGHRCADGVSTAEELDRLLSLGARRVDVGQTSDVSWVVLADPEGNEFCLLSRPVQES